MRTARLTWDEVKKIHGEHEIDVYGGEGSRLHGKPELLDKILNGCELMRLTKGIYQVTSWPEDER